jgi:hypothetical protein
VRLTRSTLSHSSALIFLIVRSRTMPALFTRMSISPKLSRIRSIIARTCAASPTSDSTISASRSPAATCSASALLRPSAGHVVDDAALAALAECADDSSPDPARTAADERDFASEIVCHSLKLFNFVPTATGWKYYADILRDKWIARKAIMVAAEIQEAAFDPAEDRDLENRVQQALVKIASMFESKAKIQTMGELILRATRKTIRMAAAS